MSLRGCKISFFLTRVFFYPIFFLLFSCLDLILIKIKSHLKTKRLGRKIKKIRKKERKVRRGKEGDIKAKEGFALLIKVLIIKILII